VLTLLNNKIPSIQFFRFLFLLNSNTMQLKCLAAV
jgi:hypothetical protein